MEKNYAYEIEKAIKERFKESKKNKQESSIETKKNLLKLVNNCKNTKKIEYIYKFRYAILNRDINNPELNDIYHKLFNKILASDENSKIFTEWNNIFSTIFGNLPAIYDKVGKNYINKIINIFCNTNNEKKLKCLMNLFISIYRIDNKELSIIDFMLVEIEKQETDHVLDNYEIIIKNINKIIDNNLLIKYFDYIFYYISNSKSIKNSEYLKELLNFFLDEENKVTNVYLISLFRIFAESSNLELISAHYTLINDKAFIKSNSILQNKCLILLKNIDGNDYMRIRLIKQIILSILIVNENKTIEQYLFSKLKTIKNNDTLELLLKLEPVLADYTDTKEYIRVIDSLEDNDNNLIKKLTINLENEE